MLDKYTNIEELSDGTKIYHCKYCEKKYKSGTGRSSHVGKHHTQHLKSKILTCNTCYLVLPTKYAYFQHKKKIHQDKTHTVCNTCDIMILNNKVEKHNIGHHHQTKLKALKK